MTMIRTAAPTVLAVSLTEAKQALKIDGNDMDALVTIWTKGVIADLEHETGQRMMEQTWEVRLPAFPGVQCWALGQPWPRQMAAAIELPHPVMTVTSVTYIDQAGTERVMAESEYRINRGRYASTLSPAPGATWPATADSENAVVVVLKCGYGNTASATPEEAQLYILAKLAEQFDPATRLERDTVQSKFIDGLLDRIRCYS